MRFLKTAFLLVKISLIMKILLVRIIFILLAQCLTVRLFAQDINCAAMQQIFEFCKALKCQNGLNDSAKIIVGDRVFMKRIQGNILGSSKLTEEIKLNGYYDIVVPYFYLVNDLPSQLLVDTTWQLQNGCLLPSIKEHLRLAPDRDKYGPLYSCLYLRFIGRYLNLLVVSIEHEHDELPLDFYFLLDEPNGNKPYLLYVKPHNFD
jgi:hypothetical protein